MADDEGAPAWIMTFADLMSLLLAFFVLLFSFSSVEEQKFEMVGGSMSEAFGVQRRFQLWDPPQGTSFIATEFSSAPPDPEQLNVVPQENLDHDRAFEAAEQPEEGGEKGVKGKGNEGTLNQQKSAGEKDKEAEFESTAPQKQTEIEEDAEEAAEAALAYIKEQLSEEILKGDLNVELDGQHLIINISEESSFEKGSVEIKNDFNVLMKKITDAIGDVEGEVQILGHTDNTPIISDRYRSNWELSTSRAVTVLHGLLESSNIKPENFVAMGYGDTRPRGDNNTINGRKTNRRVEVKVKYDAIKINRKKKVATEDEEAEFNKAIEEQLGNPIGQNNESVYDIIMKGFR